MAYDAERRLICKIIATRNLSQAVDGGLREHFFLDRRNRKVFGYLQRYVEQHGAVPTFDRMANDEPSYKWIRDVEDDLPGLVDAVARNYRMTILETALADAVDTWNADDEDATKEILLGALHQIEVDRITVRDVNLAATVEERLAEYKTRSELDDEIRGISSGISIIDKATLGFQPGQLVTVVGPPKAGKSTAMLLAALAAYLEDYVPLVIGFEMSNEEQTERVDAITAGVSHYRLRSGTLTEDEERRLAKVLRADMKDQQPLWFSNDTMSAMTLSGVAAKIQKYKPDLAIIDGVYMMQDENGEPPGSPQALTNITRGFKRLATNLHIPIIITTQVLTWKMDKKRGITDNSIGYSSSFAQDSDVIIGVEKTEDPNIIKIKIVAARNAAYAETWVMWNWDTGDFKELSQNPFEEYEEEADDRRPQVSF